MEPPPSMPSHDSRHQRSNVIQGLAGAGAGVIAAALVNPLDMVKIRLQNNQRPVGALLTDKAPGTLRILAQIRAEEGLAGLFRGFSATTIAYTIDRAIWFPVYSFLKERISLELHIPIQSIAVQLQASMAASAVAILVGNPLWVIRTRIMAQPLKTAGPSLSHSSYHYTSVLHGLKSIVKHEGWTALYKGLGPSFLGISHVAVQFPLYEQLKEYLRDKSPGKLKKKGDLSHAVILLASSLSKMTASVATYPHEVIRTRLQTQSSVAPKDSQQPHKIKYRSLWQTTRLIHKEEGWKGFYKGLGTNLLRTVPASALSLLMYEILVADLAWLL